MKPFFATLLVFLNLYAIAQPKKEYQGLLWKISGNGLEKSSYLYGTMHVSNRVAFHLSETFFNALDEADIIALETNPEYWVRDIAQSPLYQDYFSMGMQANQKAFPLYTSFIPKQPRQNELEYFLAQDQDMLNNMLWRFSSSGQNFEEGTFLDLFIYQSGKKKGKKVIALEDFEGSFRSVLLSNRFDKDAKPLSDRQALELLGNFQSWEELQEDAYRRGDLDLLDTIISSLYTSRYYRKNMLDLRNEVMARGIDSLLQHAVLFTGVGAAHLPGKKGVINLLRKMGYTLTAEDRVISKQSMEEKEEIDSLIYEHPLQSFTSDDGFVRTTIPGPMTKVISGGYQEYLYADMANGAYYSLRRIFTAAAFYGKNAQSYAAKIDSLLFENIPGKIVSNTTVNISGYPGIDIVNTTRQGDWQRYNIIYTPLEILIFKAGGNNEFVKSAQPAAYFSNISLGHSQTETATFRPRYGAFSLHLPAGHRYENYRSIYYNPFETYWAEAMDKNGNHFAVAHRQFHDFEYIEEDPFELRYFIENLEDEDFFTVDTLYISNQFDHPVSEFRFHSEKGKTYHGQVHIKGPHYVTLFSNHPDESGRAHFFNSFSFTPFIYEHSFTPKSDTSLHYSMEAPFELNNNRSFIDRVSYREEIKPPDYQEQVHERFLNCETTGEQLRVQFKKLHLLASYTSPENFWEAQQLVPEQESLIRTKDSLLFTEIRDSTFFSQGREVWFTDTNSSRAIRIKAVLENGALYTLTAVVDTAGFSTLLLDKAFKSFRPSTDTVIGQSVLRSRADYFFNNLYSHDSSRVHESQNSIDQLTFTAQDAGRIKEVITNYSDPNFKRVYRLKLLGVLAKLGDPDHINYLAELYTRYPDSSVYQFAILEALIDFKNREALKVFKELLLNETPFSNSTWTSTALIQRLEDSLKLARPLFPEILELTDFEDYRTGVYGVLAELVENEEVKRSVYKSRYSTILRRAKVQLKKQCSSDETNSARKSNQDLSNYNILLRPFARKKEVKQHFRNVMDIRNKSVLLEQLQILQGSIEIPDSLWNYAASDIRVTRDAYDFMKHKGLLGVLKPKYRAQQEIARSIAQNASYRNYDTLAFITSDKVLHKGKTCEAYFFRFKNNKKDNLWKLTYVVLSNGKGIQTLERLNGTGEEFNPRLDNVDEIIEDALKLIEVDGRNRYVDMSQNRWY